jgi:hypothetical protein
MVVAADTRKARMVSVSLDAECEELLDAMAETIGEGSRSRAVRHLIAVHAGREIKKAKNLAPPPYGVDGWAKPRLSRELASRVCGMIREGTLETDAFTLAGVSPGQASTWISRGRKDVRAGQRSLYADVVMGIAKAKAELKNEEIQKARRKGDYKFVLERQFPDEYARRTVTDATVTHQYNLVVDWDRGTLAEARDLVRLLRKFSPEAGSSMLGRHDRPAYEVVPPEIMAATIEDADYEELEDESPSTSEAPLALEVGASAGDGGQADTKAPALDAKAPALDGPLVGDVQAPLEPSGEEEISAGDRASVQRSSDELERD